MRNTSTSTSSHRSPRSRSGKHNKMEEPRQCSVRHVEQGAHSVNANTDTKWLFPASGPNFMNCRIARKLCKSKDDGQQVTSAASGQQTGSVGDNMMTASTGEDEEKTAADTKQTMSTTSAAIPLDDPNKPISEAPTERKRNDSSVGGKLSTFSGNLIKETGVEAENGRQNGVKRDVHHDVLGSSLKRSTSDSNNGQTAHATGGDQSAFGTDENENVTSDRKQTACGVDGNVNQDAYDNNCAITSGNGIACKCHFVCPAELYVTKDGKEDDRITQGLQENLLNRERNTHPIGKISDLLKPRDSELDRVEKGSVKLILHVKSQDGLDKLWEMFTSGELAKKLTEILITEELTTEDISNLAIKVNMSTSDYEKGCKFFSDLKRESATQETTQCMVNWSKDRVREWLVGIGILPSVAEEMHEENIIGKVLELYTEDDLRKDFNLKLGDTRLILYERRRWLESEKQGTPPTTEKPTQQPGIPSLNKSSTEGRAPLEHESHTDDIRQLTGADGDSNQNAKEDDRINISVNLNNCPITVGNSTRCNYYFELTPTLEVVTKEGKVNAIYTQCLQENLMDSERISNPFQIVLELFREFHSQLDRVEKGSVKLILHVKSQDGLDKLWEMFTSGELAKKLTVILITEELTTEDRSNLAIKVNMSTSDYENGCKFFSDLKKEFATQDTTECMSNWSTDRVREWLVGIGISDSLADQMHEENITGKVLELYTEDDLREDFKMTTSDARIILYKRQEWLESDKQRTSLSMEKTTLQTLQDFQQAGIAILDKCSAGGKAPPKDCDPLTDYIMAEYRRRKVIQLQCGTPMEVFYLARQYNLKNLIVCRRLLIENRNSYNLFDLKILICIHLALSQIGKHLMSADEVYQQFVRPLYALDDDNCWSLLFMMMFLWPLPNVTSERRDREDVTFHIEKLKVRCGRDFPEHPARGFVISPSLHPTYFFLGHGKDRTVFVHMTELTVERDLLNEPCRINLFWESSTVKDRLVRLEGILLNDTTVLYRAQEGKEINIKLAAPFRQQTLDQEKATFYLAFGFNGPLAYNVTLERQGRSAERLPLCCFLDAYPIRSPVYDAERIYVPSMDTIYEKFGKLREELQALQASLRGANLDSLKEEIQREIVTKKRELDSKKDELLQVLQEDTGAVDRWGETYCYEIGHGRFKPFSMPTSPFVDDSKHKKLQREHEATETSLEEIQREYKDIEALLQELNREYDEINERERKMRHQLSYLESCRKESFHILERNIVEKKEEIKREIATKKHEVDIKKDEPLQDLPEDKGDLDYSKIRLHPQGIHYRQLGSPFYPTVPTPELQRMSSTRLEEREKAMHRMYTGSRLGMETHSGDFIFEMENEDEDEKEDVDEEEDEEEETIYEMENEAEDEKEDEDKETIRHHLLSSVLPAIHTKLQMEHEDTETSLDELKTKTPKGKATPSTKQQKLQKKIYEISSGQQEEEIHLVP